MGAAWRDEGGHLPVAVVVAVDNPQPVALQALQQRLELGDFQGHVMQPFAALFDEAGHETVRSDRLDQLELEGADVEIAPIEVAGMPEPLVAAHLDRQTAAKESQRGVDVAHGDRHMIYTDVHRNARSQRRPATKPAQHAAPLPKLELR